MHRLPASRVDVVIEHLLDVNQRALARAIGVVLERGNSDGIEVIHGGGANIYLQHISSRRASSAQL